MIFKKASIRGMAGLASVTVEWPTGPIGISGFARFVPLAGLFYLLPLNELGELKDVWRGMIGYFAAIGAWAA